MFISPNNIQGERKRGEKLVRELLKHNFLSYVKHEMLFFNK